MDFKKLSSILAILFLYFQNAEFSEIRGKLINPIQLSQSLQVESHPDSKSVQNFANSEISTSTSTTITSTTTIAPTSTATKPTSTNPTTDTTEIKSTSNPELQNHSQRKFGIFEKLFQDIIVINKSHITSDLSLESESTTTDAITNTANANLENTENIADADLENEILKEIYSILGQSDREKYY